MTFARAITHQKHLAQSGRSTRSAVDIFNTLRVFTKEPIREQEIKLECMNHYQKPGVSLSHISATHRVHTPPNWPLTGVMHTIKFCTPKWRQSQETYILKGVFV